jgi:GNAT superfamily N-acetyltransferase
MKYAAGERIEYVVTHLEMTARPAFPRPHLPVGPPGALIAAEKPPLWYFLCLYDAVGRDYEWTDLYEQPEGEIAEFLHDEAVTLYTLMRAGWPHGFFLLDGREPEVCHLAYLGLVPQAIGRGLGSFLLETAVHTAWDRPDTAKVTVNTNSLDHPRALPLYQKAGFKPVRRETRSRILSRDRDLIGA